MTQLRALSAIRLSVMTDETTSPERQRAANGKAAAELGMRIVDEAVDLGVSASKTTPFQRPELGTRLARPDRFDAVIFWRFDRAVRRMKHLQELANWAEQNRKQLVFAEGVTGRLVLDFRRAQDPVTQLMLSVFAFAAEMESNATKERVTGAQAALRATPLRWRGSRPPFGYRPVKLTGGGMTLQRDDAAVLVLERIIGELRAGTAVMRIAEGLNADGIPSPRDAWSAVRGRPAGDPKKGVDRFSWSVNTIRKRLSSPALIGWKTTDGKPVRGPDGEPVPCTGDPVLTRAEFDEVQRLLGASSTTYGERKDSNALLLRVAHCATCGARMYLRSAGKGRSDYYRCSSRANSKACPDDPSVRADWLDAWVTGIFLRDLGHVQRRETRVIPGYDPAPEIAEVEAELQEHDEQRGRRQSESGKRLWEERADALDARLAELESRQAVPERTEHVPVGRSLADEWQATDDPVERRRMLLEATMRVEVKRGTGGAWRRLDLRRVSYSYEDDFYELAADAGMALATELEYDEHMSR